MNTPVFSGKLDTLHATLELFRDYEARPLALALAAGTKRHTLSVGSGGSAITAEFLARCRDTLDLGPTTVQTPMHMVLEQHDLTESDVWLFSAGGDNPDAAAASKAAFDRNARSVHLVTRNPDGTAADIVESGGGQVHVVAVAEPKDGFLASHSLLSSVVGLLLASDVVSRDPRGSKNLLDAVMSRLMVLRDHGTRAARVSDVSHLQRTDTVVVSYDPLVRPMAVLLDTSIWEASLCNVQTTDFRNLAHGRHAWLHHRTKETLIISIAGIDSRATWEAIESLLPTSLRRIKFDFGSCGRLDNTLSLIDGFSVLEAMGEILEIDPGKPGVSAFGRSIYMDRSLSSLANTMPANVRQKRSAIAKSDTHDPSNAPLDVIERKRLEGLSTAKIGGAVFDYDGTIVTTAGRWLVPEQPVVDELLRLHREGLAIGFATGRGGSAGEDLRKVLPAEILPTIPIGYYNGGHVRTADIDIECDRPPANSAITETAEWLSKQETLFVQNNFKHRNIQITVDMDQLRHPYRFPVDIEVCPQIADGRVRVIGSAHSYDIVPSTSEKLTVVETLRTQMPAKAEVLCFGDSGSRLGNDHAFLSHRLGISVGDVCGIANGCWSLFGSGVLGPNALIKILQSLVLSSYGQFHIDIASLGLDRSWEMST